jgi:hypothetical protein
VAGALSQLPMSSEPRPGAPQSPGVDGVELFAPADGGWDKDQLSGPRLAKRSPGVRDSRNTSGCDRSASAKRARRRYNDVRVS